MLSQDSTKNDYYCHVCCILCLCTRASMSIEKPVDWDTNVVWTREHPSQLATRQGAPCLRDSRISPCLLVAIMKLPTSFNSNLLPSVTVTNIHLSTSTTRANQSCAIVFSSELPIFVSRRNQTEERKTSREL